MSEITKLLVEGFAPSSSWSPKKDVRTSTTKKVRELSGRDGLVRGEFRVSGMGERVKVLELRVFSKKTLSINTSSESSGFASLVFLMLTGHG